MGKGKTGGGGKSSGQAGEAEVKARHKRRNEKLLKRMEVRRKALVARYTADNTSVSNDQLNRLIKLGVAPKKPSRPRPQPKVNPNEQSKAV